MFQHLILGLLRDGHRRHAFNLAREYERLSGNPGYPANVGRELRNLRQDGLVTREENEPGEDERRIPYAITAEGCRVFDEWLTSPAAVEDDFSIWLLFIDRVPADVCDRLLARREDALWYLIKTANHEREDALAKRGRNGDQHWRAEAIQLRWRTMQMSADLDFIRELRQELGNGAQPEDHEEGPA